MASPAARACDSSAAGRALLSVASGVTCDAIIEDLRVTSKTTYMLGNRKPSANSAAGCVYRQ